MINYYYTGSFDGQVVSLVTSTDPRNGRIYEITCEHGINAKSGTYARI